MLRDGLFSFLPELVSGRGTARRSRVVEGQSRTCSNDNVLDHAGQILEHLDRWYPQSRNTNVAKPCVPSRILRRPIATSMRLPVNFDRQSGIATEEIEAEFPPRRSLTPKFQPARTLSKFLPKQHLRQRHLTSEAAGLPHRVNSALWCRVLEHRFCPSTMLRMVPLPEPSSGRN